MGDNEIKTPVLMESTLKYHPVVIEVLTCSSNPGEGQCMVGSLTGAVSSQRVTEEHKGALGSVGHRTLECKGKSALNCETDRSSRYESRS